jgi:hypothetical protein
VKRDNTQLPIVTCFRDRTRKVLNPHSGLGIAVAKKEIKIKIYV